MAAIDDFPIAVVLELIQRIAFRCWDRKGNLYAEVILVLSVEDARTVWAASKWVEILKLAEVKQPANGGATLDELHWMLREKISGMKVQGSEEKVIALDQSEMRMIMEIEAHLDRYASRGSGHSSKKRSSWSKGKKN